MMLLAGHVLHIEHIPTWTAAVFALALVIGLVFTVRWVLSSSEPE